MPYSVKYFNERVLAEIEGWPDGLLAEYARLVELLMESWYCYVDGERVVVPSPSSRRPGRRPIAI
jgi:hypothetical protein